MNRLQSLLYSLRAKYIPSLVWRNDPIEVRVQFPLSEETLQATHELREIFTKMGISFDTGGGCGTRDWEWDYSLRGPIEVRFVRKKR